MVDMLEGGLILHLGGNHVVGLGRDDILNTRHVVLIIVIQVLFSSKVSRALMLVWLAILEYIG